MILITPLKGEAITALSPELALEELKGLGANVAVLTCDADAEMLALNSAIGERAQTSQAAAVRFQVTETFWGLMSVYAAGPEKWKLLVGRQAIDGKAVAAQQAMQQAAQAAQMRALGNGMRVKGGKG